MSIDIVVVNYKTPKDLQRFLASLETFAPTIAATLTVVDVDTEPFERRFVWGGGLPGRTVGVKGNVGYGVACNLGASYGTASHIALFNADVMLINNAIDQCHDALARNRWAILGPRQIDLGGHIRHAGIFGTLCAPVHRGWSERDIGQYADVRDAVTVSGSAYFIDRAVWEELTVCPSFQAVAPGAQGAFLPTAHYYEETWCSYHAFAHGHRIIYYGLATVIHQWHSASPLGGWAEQQIPASRTYFRKACDHHGISHD